MNEFIIYIVIALIFCGIGFYIGKLLTKLTSEKEKATLEERASLIAQSKEIVDNNYIELQKEYKEILQEKESLVSDKTRLETEYKNTEVKLAENKGELEKLNEKFIKELADNDLLLELEVRISFASGETKKLVGLYNIDEKKVQELSDDKVLDFHKRGLFIPIHAMLGSVGQINRLAQLRNQSDSEVKVNAIRFVPVTPETEAEK